MSNQQKKKQVLCTLKNEHRWKTITSPGSKINIMCCINCGKKQTMEYNFATGIWVHGCEK